MPQRGGRGSPPNPERYLRVDPGLVARAVPLDGALRLLGLRPAAARAVADRDRRQGRVPPLQGRAAGVPGRARALVRLPLGAAALPHPDLARPHEDRGGEPAALGARRAAGRAGGDSARASRRARRRARSCAGRRAICWTRSRRPSCRRRSRSSSSCAIAGRARCSAVRPRRAARRRSTTTTTDDDDDRPPSNPPTPPANCRPPSTSRSGRAVSVSARACGGRETISLRRLTSCEPSAHRGDRRRPDPSVAQAARPSSRPLVMRGQRPAVARPEITGERADDRLEQVIALDAALPPDAGTEAQLGRQRLEDARARLALAQVLLERRARSPSATSVAFGYTSIRFSFSVNRSASARTRCAARAASGPVPWPSAFARRRCRRWRARWTSVVRCVYGVIDGLPRRCRRFAGRRRRALGRRCARISTTDGSTHASWPGQTGTAQRKHGGSVSGASMQSNVSSP